MKCFSPDSLSSGLFLSSSWDICSKSISECIGCKGMLYTLYKWISGSVGGGAVINGTWFKKDYKAFNKWTSVIDPEALVSLVNSAIPTFIGGVFKDESICKYKPLINQLISLACTCGVNVGGDRKCNSLEIYGSKTPSCNIGIIYN